MKAKIALILVIISTTAVMAEKAYSQTAKISIEAGDKSIEFLMDEIEEQSEFYFIFNQKQIDVDRVVNISANNESIENVLPRMFADTDVKYIVLDKKILLTKEKESFISLAQQMVVTGTVTDTNGEPLPGVTIIVMGTTIGVLTDLNGNYEISVPSANSILQFSFIGFISQEITVGSQRTISIVLEEDVQVLDEVVVIGYGTQAKRDITGAVSVVSAESLAESSSVTFAEALQGKSSGVYVTTSGAPGAESTIRVRGVGSVNGSDPLVIIDGVSGGTISSVNSNDIETFQVLKDASATAIYGAQGANGVIIITTKQGTKTGQPRVSYNGYVGLSTMANNGFEMVGAYDWLEFAAEGMRNYHNYRAITTTATELAHPQFGTLQNYTTNTDGTWSGGTLTMPFTTVPAGYSYQDVLNMFGDGTGDELTAIQLLQDNYQDNGPNSYALSSYYYNLLTKGLSEEEAKKGTNWYDLVVQKGVIMNHQLSIVGGNEKGQYSASISYTGQEGTLKASYYDRYSLRLNTIFNPREHVSIGVNTSLSLTEYQGERGGGGVFINTYNVKSWVAPYNVSGQFAGTWNEGGQTTTALASVSNAVGDWTRGLNSQNSAYLEINPIYGLTLKSQGAIVLSGSWARVFSERSIEWNKEGIDYNSLAENSSYNINLQWTNTATYSREIDDHKFTAVIGSEFLDQNYGRSINGSRLNFKFPNDQNTWVLDNGSTVDQTTGGNQSNRSAMFGYFGRVDYSFNDKYLTTVTVRRDASSKFSERNRWGTFPSLSLGWRISSESFMDNTKSWLDDLKLRIGYGTTGNSNIGEYNWSYQYSQTFPGFWVTNFYYYALDGSNNNLTTGYSISSLGDNDAKWETTRMLNMGFDASLLKDRLTIGFDYYIKRTSDMLVEANWSALAGNAEVPNINIGDMKNNGIDLNLGWEDKIGKISYGLIANISQYKNTITRLGSSDILYSTWTIPNITITSVGQPIGMYYGYNILGIYTSEDDVLNYKTGGVTVLPYGRTKLSDLVPSDYVGRYKIEDINKDGFIDEDDQTVIGNPHPDFTGGLNIKLGYGGWDLSSYMYFSMGNDLYKLYMEYNYFGSRGSDYTMDRWEKSWSPSNPDGIYPMWVGTSHESSETTSLSNSLYIDDGSYLRMQNLQLGYTIPDNVNKKLGLNKCRIYGQVSNLFTITNYPGLEPEITSTSDLQKGIDTGGYGLPRQFIVGVNLTF